MMQGRRLVTLAAVLVLAVFVLRRWVSEPASSGPAVQREAAVGEKKKRPERVAGPALPDEPPEFDLRITRGDFEEKVGRDVFRFYYKPTPVPPTPKPPPTPIPLESYHRYPMPLPPTPAPTPIVPPSIPYTVIGLFGPKDKPIVAFDEAGKTFAAREGDTVGGRFIVKKVNRESVDIAFKDLPPDITRRLPIPGPDSRR